MTLTLQSAIRDRAASNQAEQVARYHSLICDAARGAEVDPDEFIAVAEAAGISPESAARHLDILGERIEAAKAIADMDGDDAKQRRDDAERLAKELFAEFERVRDECTRRIQAAQEAAAVARNQADAQRHADERVKVDAARVLHHSCDPDILAAIEQLNREIRELQEEQNGMRPRYFLSELTAWKAAQTKAPDSRTADERAAVARFGQLQPSQRDWADAERFEERKREIPEEIAAKNAAIAELRQRQLDPVAGMKW